MPLFTLAQLTTPLTRDEVQTKIYDVIAALGTRTTSWKPGAVVRTMVTSSSVCISAFSELTAAIAKSGFVELAEREWLALAAWFTYGVEKEYATFATGPLTLTNAGGGIYSLDPGDLIALNPTTGKQFRNAEPIELPALGEVTVTIVAVEAGAASTSAPGTITELVTTLAGVTITNPGPVAGLDAEEDPVLRARCQEKLGSLSPFGPWDAYTFAARNARRADGSRVGVTRVRTRPDGFGNITTYIASSSGPVTGTVGDLSTDLGAVEEAIQQLAAPLGITAYVESAAAVSVPVTYRVSMYNTSGLTEAEIADTIARRLITFMAAQPVGGHKVGSSPGKLHHDAIQTAIGSSLPQIFHVEVTSPAADIELAINEVPVLGTVTATAITQVPPSEGTL